MQQDEAKGKREEEMIPKSVCLDDLCKQDPSIPHGYDPLEGGEAEPEIEKAESLLVAVSEHKTEGKLDYEGGSVVEKTPGQF